MSVLCRLGRGVRQAGWPLFGLMSTINLRKAQIPELLNNAEIDGLADEAGLFFQNEVLKGLTEGNSEALNRAGAFYLQLDAGGSALAPLTALASQTLGASIVQERLAFLETFQARPNPPGHSAHRNTSHHLRHTRTHASDAMATLASSEQLLESRWSLVYKPGSQELLIAAPTRQSPKLGEFRLSSELQCLGHVISSTGSPTPDRH